MCSKSWCNAACLCISEEHTKVCTLKDMYGNAGQGREHAKWSPVATAWYKLLPEVDMIRVCLPHLPAFLSCALLHVSAYNKAWADLASASKEAVEVQNVVWAHAVLVGDCVACLLSHKCAEGCVLHVQPMTGERADELSQECPGLIEVVGKGKRREAKVTSARQHPKLLEKVLLSWFTLCICMSNR